MSKLQARENDNGDALLTPLWVVFYSPVDILYSDLGFFSKLYHMLRAILICVLSGSRYHHVQPWYHQWTTVVPCSGTTMCCPAVPFDPTKPGYTIAYRIIPWTDMGAMVHTPRAVSLWKTIKWFYKGGCIPVNCISDTEMVMRYHLTKDLDVVCETVRRCNSIAEIEEQIVNFRWSDHYTVFVPSGSEPRVHRLVGVEDHRAGVQQEQVSDS